MSLYGTKLWRINKDKKGKQTHQYNPDKMSDQAEYVKSSEFVTVSVL